MKTKQLFEAELEVAYQEYGYFADLAMYTDRVNDMLISKYLPAPDAVEIGYQVTDVDKNICENATLKLQDISCKVEL